MRVRATIRTKHWTSIRALIRSGDRDGARLELLTVLERYQGHMGRTAWELGVTDRLVRAWVAELGVREQLDAIRERATAPVIIENARAALALSSARG